MLGPNDYEALGLWLWSVDFFVGVDKVTRQRERIFVSKPR